MREGEASKVAAWICLAVLLFTAQRLTGRLPVSGEGLAAEKYAGWSGVLRVWICTGWPPGGGSFIPWLNACAAQYEKAHPGVYVQASSVSEATLAEFARDGALAPDAILFAPGMLQSPRDLLALGEKATRDDIGRCGMQGQTRYAVPVAMGGYAWAYNRDLLERVPADFSRMDDLAPARKQKRTLTHLPADEPYRKWSKAMKLLLGDGKAPRLLPEDYGRAKSVMDPFTAGLTAAIPVTQREIRRLQILSDSGRAPEWAVTGRCAYTDQLLLCALVNVQKPDAQTRQALTEQWLDNLLTEESQQKLSIIRALRVTDGEPLYGHQRGMDALEASCLSPTEVPEAFSTII